MRAFKGRCATIASILLFPLTVGFGQPKPLYVEIGNHEIRLGMSIDQVVSILQKEQFRIQAEDADNSLPLRAWYIWGPPTGEWTKTFAVIYTKGNLIVGIIHRLTWGGDLQDVFDSLFFAVSDLSKESRTQCSIGAGSNYVRDGSIASIQFECGGRRISITRTEGTTTEGKKEKYKDYDVSETIGTVRTFQR